MLSLFAGFALGKEDVEEQCPMPEPCTVTVYCTNTVTCTSTAKLLTTVCMTEYMTLTQISISCPTEEAVNTGCGCGLTPCPGEREKRRPPACPRPDEDDDMTAETTDGEDDEKKPECPTGKDVPPSPCDVGKVAECPEEGKILTSPGEGQERRVPGTHEAEQRTAEDEQKQEFLPGCPRRCLKFARGRCIRWNRRCRCVDRFRGRCRRWAPAF